MDDSAFDELKKKNVHPKQKAGFLSKLFFCWGFSILYKGCKKELDEDDLYKPLKEHESHKLGDRLEDFWKQEKSTNKHPKLWRAIWNMFKKEIIGYGVLQFFLEFCLRLSQPLAIGQLMNYYQPNQISVTLNEAYMYAAFIVLTSFLGVLVSHCCLFGLQSLGMKIRIACCSLIYRKSLRLSKAALGKTTIGQMVNLLSNDVNRFDDIGTNFHYLWLAPIETGVIMYLMYRVVGLTSLAGFSLLVIFIPLQMFMGKLTSIYRLRTAIKTDERVRLMGEIISGIQVIKMYTWEESFTKLVEFVRKCEIKQIRSTSYLRALHVSYNKFITRTAVFLCILVYSLMGNRPNAEYVYVVFSFYNILKDTVTTKFPQAVASLAETIVSINRIQDFLSFEEIKKSKLDSGSKKKSPPYTSTPLDKDPILKNLNGIVMQRAYAKWHPNLTEETISNINFSVGMGELAAIVGPVGSGKSSFLCTILKELPLSRGSVDVGGTISYASQEPWLFAGTIKQNILFGEKWNKSKYEKVVKVCALERDFEQLPYGDRSIVGDKGVTISGGQRARINLARAIYKDADVYLLDDPLSAVDTFVGKQLFQDCISEYLKNKCTILITHQLQYLRNVDKICLMENGKIVITGNYEELKNSGKDFSTLLNDHLEDDKNDDTIDEESLKQKKISITDEPSEIKEQKSIGGINSRVYKSYLRACGGWFPTILVALLFGVSQAMSSGADYFISFWVNLEQTRLENEIVNDTFYRSYFDDVLVEEEVETVLGDRLLRQQKIDQFFTTEHCFYIYSFTVGGVIIAILIRSMSFYALCMKASTKLHNKMFHKVIKGTMQFFNTNSTGRILNRFSKDMGAVDEVLPYVMIDTMQIAMNVIAINVIIALVNPWILISTMIILGLFYVYRSIYLASSRNIKRMEATTRSPVFSHINASLQGLTTIRAYGAQEVLKKEFDTHQDLHSSAFYLFVSCNRTFGFWLDFHCVIYLALITLSMFFLGDEAYGGNVGLAITQAMSLTGMFQWGMRQWSELENCMTSVERIVEFTDIHQEGAADKPLTQNAWPKEGNVEFKSVYLKYGPSDPFVLNNLIFDIKSGEKVGIVGRTGAGKSSIISALFRLADFEGLIIIDGISTKDLPLHSIRSKISIIPQEPVLFSGTLRSNLDPFSEHTDSDLWSALEEVELKAVVSDFPSGLDSKVSEGGSNFSVGQRQLICLARAIVRKNNILVLDEATANVDPKTDAMIQNTIRTKFSQCTVLTIAHRLHTVMDSDKVIVMDEGRVAQFGHPFMLLQDIHGIFYGLVRQTGKSMSEHLAEIAEKSFYSKEEAK
ncbi:unnamed protein product [Brassicogethes aeneus]|uniref:Multidrug resistance-associated protein lethal(2)03659 n=1 Tax=Brassicogethes aeneus TaxID=1431903 RepID=A0A9P0B607_BRAAE|nr:unnamed protein product [Brassicogethes aeneus]